MQTKTAESHVALEYKDQVGRITMIIMVTILVRTVYVLHCCFTKGDMRSISHTGK